MSNLTLYLIDVSGLCYRAYYALPSLATSYGQPTGAVFGFTNILNKILKDNPEYLACCFDVSRETFRKDKFVNYKIQRPPMPDELVNQMSLIKEVVSDYNIAVFELAGYEADDLIASLNKKAKDRKMEVVIVSSDKDILQLVDKDTKVLDPKKDKDGIVYDQKQVELRFGLEPKRIVDMISLMGDKSDNIPGVPGIGEKTAVSLLKEFGNIETLIDNSPKIKSKSLSKAISDNVDNIRLSYELASLKDDMDLDFDLDKLKRKTPDYDKLFSLFKKLEFTRLLKDIPAGDNKNSEAKFELLKDAEKKDEILGLVRQNAKIFLYFSKEEDKIYFSYGHDGIYAIDSKDESLVKILCDSRIKKIGHNLKELKISYLKNKLNISGLNFDTMLAAYLVDSATPNFGLQELAFRYLDQRYAGDDTSPAESLRIIMAIMPILERKLKENSLEELFCNLEMPLVCVLASMQINGVKIDTASLKNLSLELEKTLIQLRANIYSLNNGEEFNLNSPKQLAIVLFQRLSLPIIKKTKTGASTDEEVLLKLSRKHELPSLLLEYRQLTKLKNTYIDNLPQLIDPASNRIHATFDQVGTETGRLSSNNPNLQNIPIKGNVASLIRQAFIPDEKNIMISADYSQIELRVLAHFSKDEALINAFKNNLDIHKYTASLIFNTSEEEVTDAMRETAKRINFGIVYGMSSFGLAKDLDIAHDEARAFIDAYFLRYPGVKRFIDEQIKSARMSGYATTLLGRRRFLPGISSNNNSLKSFAERQAVNSAIQGSAADLIKLAMINIHESFQERSSKAIMIMQIHDELVFEIPEAEFKNMIFLIREKMERVFDLLVPIKVNIKQGQNWSRMQSVV